MNFIKAGIFISALLSTIASAKAQDGPLRGTVNVDGKYLPDVIRQDRVNTLPRLYTFNMESMSLDYDINGVTTPFAPGFSTLPVTGWQANRKIRDYKGYVDLNLGSWLNSSLSAGYHALSTETDDLAIWLQHNSTSLFKPKMSLLSEKIKRERYDETVGVDYSHLFSDSGRLNFGVDYHLGYFNYYGFYAPGTNVELEKVPNQTLNDLSARIGWASLSGNSLSYDATLSARYFGYRRLYMYDPLTPAHPKSFKGEKETHFNLDGGISYALDSSSSLGIKLNGDVLTYDTPLWEGESINDYGRVNLSPYYRFTQGNLDINLGTLLDFTFNAGPKDDRFSTFHIAPDVRLDYRAGIAGLYVHLTGGTQLNTLARQANEDYYCLPVLLSTTPSYSPVDGKAGINFGPMAGVTAGLAFAYKVVNHIPLSGLYTMYLNNNTPSGLSVNESFNPLYAEGINMKGWSVQANIGFDISKSVNFVLEGSYQPQNGTKGYWNGIDRPRWILDARCTFAPVEPLHITLAYSYRGVRNVYTHITRTPAGVGGIVAGGKEYEDYMPIRLPDVTDLAIRASYNVTPAFSLSVQADNLLNRKIQLFPDVVSQGINILGGVQLTF